MEKIFLLFLTFLLLLRPSSSSLSDSSQNPNPSTNSAYEVLKNNGFPVGLLPSNVFTYSLNRTSGDFAVELSDSCQILLPPDNYLATYARRITGKLVETRIAELSGIRVWAFFKWWSITGIRSSGDNLVFEVGVVTAKYPSNNFDESPECRGRKSSS